MIHKDAEVEYKLCQRIDTVGGVMQVDFLDGTTKTCRDTNKFEAIPGDTFWTQIRGRLVYHVQARPGYELIEKLGMIWSKPDGRWNWVRHASKCQAGWDPKQGVAKDEEEAKQKVLQGWAIIVAKLAFASGF